MDFYCFIGIIIFFPMLYAGLKILKTFDNAFVLRVKKYNWITILAKVKWKDEPNDIMILMSLP